LTVEDVGLGGASLAGSGSNRMARCWGGGPRCWQSRSAAIGAPAVGMCGARTPARMRSRGRSCPAVACGGRWKASCVSAP